MLYSLPAWQANRVVNCRLSGLAQSGEDDRAYFTRVRKQATQAKAGIAFRRGGGAYLGLRHEASAAKPTLHAWEVAKVPWTWTEEDSTQCLQGAGCSDIAILRRGGGRKKWVVKCIFPDADVGAITEILAGETCLVLTRAQSRAHVGISTPLKAHAAAELRAPTTRPGGSVKQDGVAAVPAAGTPKLAKSPVTAEEARGRSRSRGKKDKPSNALCEEIDCGAEGACGFLCLAAALGLQNSESWDKIKGELAVRSRTLRSEIFTWIGRHRKDVEPLWEQDGKTTEETEGGAIPEVLRLPRKSANLGLLPLCTHFASWELIFAPALMAKTGPPTKIA